MIEVSFIYKTKDGTSKEDARKFNSKQMALRFMYGMSHKGNYITGWKCDLPDDNEWLNKRFHLSEHLRKGGK